MGSPGGGGGGDNRDGFYLKKIFSGKASPAREGDALSMTKFEEHVVICRPVDKVFAYVADLKNSHKWQTSLESLNITSEKQTGAGATYHIVNRIMGYRIEANGIVSEYEADRCCIYKVVSGLIMGQSRMSVEPFGEGTKLTIEAEADLNTFRLMKSLIASKARKQLSMDLKTLKKVLENES